MAGVAVVARSGGHYEASGELQPGKLKNVLGLAFLASFCFALSLASGARASFRAPRRPAKVWCREPRHRRERRGPGHRRGCQGHCHGRQEDRQGRLVHRDAGLRLLGSQVRPAGQQRRPQWRLAGSSRWPRGSSSASIDPTSRTDPSMIAGMPIR